MKKQSFAKGAMLLAVATGLGKIFSAGFKIPLDRFFLHADGMAIFNSAYNIYMLFFTIATAGIPLALSRLIASCKSEEEENEILSTSLVSTLLILGISAIVIFIFSEPISLITGLPEVAPLLKIIAPALVFCALTASMRGFFQGKRNMFPPALSQVSDSFGRLFLGFLLAFLLIGQPVETAAAGAIGGVPFGAVLSALILICAFYASKHRLKISFSFETFKKIFLLAIPLTITSSMHPISNMIDTVSVVGLLNAFSFDNASVAFGCLGRAAMLYALPVSIATAVAASVLPAVTENEKNHNYDALFKDSSLAVRLALAISLPCTAGFISMSDDIFHLLFNDKFYPETLTFIAPSAFLLSVGLCLASILQGMGKTKATVISAFAAFGTKCILNVVLLSFFGIGGAALATSIAYLVFVLFLFGFIVKLTPLRFKFNEIILKPFICAAICFLTAQITSIFFPAPVAIAITAIVYVPSIIVTKFISTHELNQIFTGR